jgi:hypothetical protein
MICRHCFQDREAKDFINKQEVCYKCSFELKKRSEKKLELIPECRICGKIIPEEKDGKKCRRKVYCSTLCSLKGHKLLNESYWTRELKKEVPLKFTQSIKRFSVDHC